MRGLYTASDGDVKALREAGFTAAHIAPRDGLFAGMGAVVLLRDVARGEYAETLFLPETETAIAQIDGASGVYPATTMGVLAVMRETVENARRENASRAAFRQDASGATRPMYDPVAEALQPVLDGDRALVFYADGWLDAFRALRATDEMRIRRTVLAGVPDVAPVLERIRARGVPVIAPLALPDTVATDSLSEGDRAAAADGGRPRRRLVHLGPPDGELPRHRRREGRAHGAAPRERQAAEASPARLASAEVPFAFGSFEAKGKDVRANLHRMVEAGLSPEAALAALTTAPAEMMGVERELGTVERGKLANLVVTTGDYFVDSTDVRFVFVEGVRHEIEATKKKASGDPDAVVVVAGTWNYSVEAPGNSESSTFTVTGEAGSYEGQIQSQGDTLPLTSITVEGNSLTFSFTIPNGPDVTVTGIIENDELDGTADVGSFGAFPFTATRQPE